MRTIDIRNLVRELAEKLRTSDAAVARQRRLQALHLDVLLSFAEGEPQSGEAVKALIEAFPETSDASLYRDVVATALELLGDEADGVAMASLSFAFRDRLTELRDGLR